MTSDFFTEIANAKFETWWEDCGVRQAVPKEQARLIFIDGCCVGPANREELEVTRRAWGASDRHPQIEQGECGLCGRQNLPCLVFDDIHRELADRICAHCLQFGLETSKAVLLALRETKP